MLKSKKAIKTTAVVIATTVFFTQSVGYADWASDWLQNKSSGGPSFLEGQARDVVSGGSFSARWPVDNSIHPVSANPPHINAGCGGIDAYAGSISFLNPEMLVKKLQGILQNSAGVAFELALTTLCPQCKTIMNDMESISNFLNSMSMNSCQAAKGLVTAAAGEADSMLGGKLDAASSAAVQSGLSQSFTQFNNGNLSSLFGISATDLNKAVTGNTGVGNMPTRAGCTDPILSALFPDSGNYPIYVLNVIGVKTLGLPQDYVDMMRGLVGDIEINDDSQGYRISQVTGCSKNMGVSLDDILNGVSAAKDSSSNCSDVGVGSSILTYVSTTMTSIAGKLSTNASLAPNEVAFITLLPLPILQAMRMGVASNQSATVVSDISGIVASYWLEMSLKDLLQRTDAILSVTNDVNNNTNNGGTNVSTGTACNLSVEAPSFKEQSKIFKSNVTYFIKQLDDGLAKQLDGLKQTQDFTANLQKTNDLIKGYLTKQYGPSVAERATRLLHS